MKKNNLNLKRLIITTIAFVLISLQLTVVFAWLLREDTVKNVGISNFETKADIYFSNGTTRTEVNGFVVGGLVKVNLFDTTAANFIGNLRLDVIHKGFSPCYLRVRILEQWIDDKSDEIMPGDIITYQFPGGWYDNRVKDLCIYHIDAISTYDDNTPITKTIPVIMGTGGYIGADTGVSLYLQVKVETIQPNRVEDFWGADKIAFLKGWVN